MNMPKFLAADWMMTAINMIEAPIQMVILRPIPSERYGANGYAAKEPMFWDRPPVSTCL